MRASGGKRRFRSFAGSRSNSRDCTLSRLFKMHCIGGRVQKKRNVLSPHNQLARPDGCDDARAHLIGRAPMAGFFCGSRGLARTLIGGGAASLMIFAGGGGQAQTVSPPSSPSGCVASSPGTFGQLACGPTSTATGTFSTAIGQNATATGSGASAFGQTTSATGANSTAVGNVSLANATNATAVGGVSTAFGTNSTAVGQSAAAGGP